MVKVRVSSVIFTKISTSLPPEKCRNKILSLYIFSVIFTLCFDSCHYGTLLFFRTTTCILFICIQINQYKISCLKYFFQNIKMFYCWIRIFGYAYYQSNRTRSWKISQTSYRELSCILLFYCFGVKPTISTFCFW